MATVGAVIAIVGAAVVVFGRLMLPARSRSSAGGTSEGGSGTGADSILVQLVKHYEGFSATAKPDPLGIPTIGYGHVVVGGEPPAPWSERQAAEILAGELVEYENMARDRWEEKTGQPWQDLTESKRAAYTSAVYNAGPTIISSGSWPLKTNPTEAAQAFYSWSTGVSGGKRIRLAGLVRRRFTEWKLARTGILDFQPAGWQAWYNQHRG